MTVRNNAEVGRIADEQEAMGLPYNYFRVEAAYQLLCLLGITKASPDQVRHATQCVENAERYAASKAGAA